MVGFVNMRLVQVFGDKSELHYLPDSLAYVWQRRGEGGALVEVPIIAGDDMEALREVVRISEEEYRRRMLTGELSRR